MGQIRTKTLLNLKIRYSIWGENKSLKCGLQLRKSWNFGCCHLEKVKRRPPGWSQALVHHVIGDADEWDAGTASMMDAGEWANTVFFGPPGYFYIPQVQPL